MLQKFEKKLDLILCFMVILSIWTFCNLTSRHTSNLRSLAPPRSSQLRRERRGGDDTDACLKLTDESEVSLSIDIS